MRKYLPSPPVFKLFVFMGIVWAAIVGPLSSVLILKSFGATSPQIGVFSAICAVITLVCQPIWGLLSDKVRSPRRVLCFCLGVSTIFFSCVLLAKNLYMAAGLMILEVVFRSSVIALLDSHTLAEVNVIPGLHYSQIPTEVESMTHIVRRLQEENRLRAYFEFQIVEGFAGNMLWDKGTLIYRKEYEAMLYHLVRFKRKYSEPVDLQRIIPDKFRIGKKKIYY